MRVSHLQTADRPQPRPAASGDLEMLDADQGFRARSLAMHVARSLACLAALLAAPACGPLAGNVADEAATKAVEAPIETLQDPEQQQKLEDVATDPQIQESTRAMSRAVTEGIMQGVVEGLEADDGQLRASLAEVMGELRPEVNAMVSEATHSAVRAMIAAAADGIEQDLAPALRQAVPSDLGDALLSPLQDETFHEAVGALTQTISYNAMVGTDKGLQAVQARQEAGVSEGPLAVFGMPLTVGWLAVVLFASGVGIALIALSILLYMNRSQRRYLEGENRRREAMMFNMMQVMLARDMDEEERQRFLGEMGFARVPLSQRGNADGHRQPPPSIS